MHFPLRVFAVSGWSYIGTDSAVVKVGDGCTGTRISNDGHVLTARHCFTDCLINSSSVEEEVLFPEFGWRSQKLYKLKSTAFCEASINGVDEVIEILAIGPGFMTPMEQSSLVHFDKELYTNFLNKSYFHNGDFAIIKVQESQVASCKKVSLEPLDNNKEVSFRGYPMQSTGRPDGRNSDGKSLLEGSGFVIDSVFENSCIDEQAHNSEALRLRYDRSDLILSTVDNLPGGSGSALLNVENRIIGLVNSQYRQGIDIHSTYCSGSTVAVSIEHIFKLLDEMGFGEDKNKFFNCEGKFVEEPFYF